MTVLEGDVDVERRAGAGDEGRTGLRGSWIRGWLEGGAACGDRRDDEVARADQVDDEVAVGGSVVVGVELPGIGQPRNGPTGHPCLPVPPVAASARAGGRAVVLDVRVVRGESGSGASSTPGQVPVSTRVRRHRAR